MKCVDNDFLAVLSNYYLDNNTSNLIDLWNKRDSYFKGCSDEAIKLEFENLFSKGVLNIVHSNHVPREIILTPVGVNLLKNFKR